MKKTPSGVRAGNETPNAGGRVSSEETAGFVEDSAAVCKTGLERREPEREAEPAGWMTPTLIEKTHAVWEKQYGRPLERSEVLEILRNVRWFGELLRRGLQGGKS